MTEVVSLAAVAVACWLFRITFVLVVPAERLPERVQQALTYLAPAVLAGMVAVELTSVVSPSDLTGSGLSFAALALVALVAYRSRSLTLAVCVGLAAVLAIDLLL
jgi:branched-subunit amino acid transport protein